MGKKSKSYYKVEITETLQRTIRIKANSEDEAYHKVKQMHRDELIILNDDDFIEVEFEVLENE